MDTWAATSAGAMTLSENALYTVDGWQVFYDHLKPGGVITFSRWSSGRARPIRLFAVAQGHAAQRRRRRTRKATWPLITSGNVVTLLASNLPFSEPDLRRLREIMNEMEFKPLYLPGEGTTVPELQQHPGREHLDRDGGAPRIGATWTTRRSSIRRPISLTPSTSRHCPQ